MSVVAAAVVIGCGGSSGHSGTTGSTAGSTNGGSTTGATSISLNSSVVSSDYGRVRVTFLTGQGRRAAGDLTAIVTQLTFQDANGLVTRPLDGETSVPLSNFIAASKYVNIPFTGQGSRLFENYELDINRFQQDNGDGTSTEINGSSFSQSFPANIRVFPGRNTNVPIYLDDSIFYIDSNTGNLTFDNDQFTYKNYTDGKIRSFIDDYVSFDISSPDFVGTRPTLVSTGETAARIFISGDNYALAAQDPTLSNPNGLPASSRGHLEVLTPLFDEPVTGNYLGQGTVQGRPIPGTYSLQAPDPTDLAGFAKIASTQGEWHDLKTVISGAFGTFQMISFPTSRDDVSQEFAMIRLNGNGKVIDMYFGTLNFDSGEFRAYPIADLPDASITGEIDGTVSNLRTKNGATTNVPSSIRYGTFTFTSGQTLPAGFPNTGTFLVFRQ